MYGFTLASDYVEGSMMGQRNLKNRATAFELAKLEEKLNRPLDADERIILEERRIVLRERMKPKTKTFTEIEATLLNSEGPPGIEIQEGLNAIARFALLECETTEESFLQMARIALEAARKQPM